MELLNLFLDGQCDGIRANNKLKLNMDKTEVLLEESSLVLESGCTPRLAGVVLTPEAFLPEFGSASGCFRRWVPILILTSDMGA